MLSEGRRGIDNVFSLRDGMFAFSANMNNTTSCRREIDSDSFLGVLRLELDRAMYERCGLEGQPIPHGGRKHTKERFGTDMPDSRHRWIFPNLFI